MELTTPISELGPFVRRYAKDLERFGIRTLGDAFFYFPFRYDDFSNLSPLRDVVLGTSVSVRGTVRSISAFRTPRRHVQIIEALLVDETGQAVITWFGQKFLTNVIHAGDELIISGVAESSRGALRFTSPAWEPAREMQTHAGRIVPVYSVGGAITPKVMRAVMRIVLAAAPKPPELLDLETRERHSLLSRDEMVPTLHFPESMNALAAAERTRDFEQLFLLALGNAFLRADLERYRAHGISFSEKKTKDFVGRLPFQITEGQRVAAWEILKDLGRERPMNRLLDGDVGAGKTLVAAIAALNAIHDGAQSVFLVPTSVLALQHFATLQKLYEDEPVRLALLTGAACRVAEAGETKEIDRDELSDLLARGEIHAIVGTHALLEDKISFARLALAVVDEQHRFGVAQRRALSGKAGKGMMPHLLSMTATPIPRTLALTAYGDLDLSRIPERPPGRVPVKTSVLTRGKAETVSALLKQTVTAGHQAFVVCPRITEEGKSARRSVAEVSRELRERIPDLRIAELHGKLKPAERDAVMLGFVKGEFDVLVATTVIEVGVDVPNATLMIIDGAEAFGLAQLHQLRGRVGRGKSPGACVLIPHQAGIESLKRLRLLERSHDGWKLAEEDLRIRGPGQILGTAQTGFEALTFSALHNDKLRLAARAEAEALLQKNPDLKKAPHIRAILEERFKHVQLS